MKDHVITAHDSGCGKCTYESNSIETLDVHIGKNHTDHKDKINCGLCEKAFYTRENALIIDTIRNKINDYPSDYFPL